MTLHGTTNGPIGTTPTKPGPLPHENPTTTCDDQQQITLVIKLSELAPPMPTPISSTQNSLPALPLTGFLL
jgi:hypothetical protein